jgi:hypothetical protein
MLCGSQRQIKVTQLRQFMPKGPIKGLLLIILRVCLKNMTDDRTRFVQLDIYIILSLMSVPSGVAVSGPSFLNAVIMQTSAIRSISLMGKTTPKFKMPYT